MSLKTPFLFIAIMFFYTFCAAENVLRWSGQGDALTLDPHSQNEGPTYNLVSQIYEPLIMRDNELNLLPGLAEKWVAAPEGWTFSLRKGVKFHDGSDFSAEDVVFSINRAKLATSDYQVQANNINSIEVIDEYTIKLLTNGPNPILANQLTRILIMDKQWAENNNVERPQDFDIGEETFSVRNANGTGLFKLEIRHPEELTTMVRNDKWWGNDIFPVNLDRIEYWPIKNDATRIGALLSGKVDLLVDLPSQDIQHIKNTAGLTVASVPEIRTIFFGMDQASKELRSSNIKNANPFSDLRVREAINLAIDRNAIQHVVMDGQSFPSGTLTAPGVFGYSYELDHSYSFDLEKAKNLMAQAGYENGFDVQLDCPNNRYLNDEYICQATASMLARIGINVKLVALPKSQHFPKIQMRTTDFYMLGWGVPTLDSHYVFSYLFKHGVSSNATEYNNLRVNELISQIETETDLQERKLLIDEVWQQVHHDIPYIPIHHQMLSWAYSSEFDIPISPNNNFKPHFVVAK